MRLFAMALATILAVQLAQAASNETGYRLFNDSHGDLILDMWNNNRTQYDPDMERNITIGPIHYYVPEEWTRTTNMIDNATGDPIWKEQVDMGAGYLPAGEVWNGSNMVSYWIRNFTNWQFGVGTDNDHLTWASVEGSRTIQGRIFTLKKTNYLTNDSPTMLVNESLTSSGSTPVPIYALYKHSDFIFQNPIMRAKLNGTWTDIPLDGSVHQLYRGTDISLQDTILGELLPDGQMGFQIRFGPMSNYSYWIFVNGTEVFEAVRLGQFNRSETISTERGWADAFCTVTPGCTYTTVSLTLDGVPAVTRLSKEVGNNVVIGCRAAVSSPCNPIGLSCSMDRYRLAGRPAFGAAEEPLDYSPPDGSHFYQFCNESVDLGIWCNDFDPPDNTWVYKNAGLAGNTTNISSGAAGIFANGFRYRCIYTTPFITLNSLGSWINATDNNKPSKVLEVLPINNSNLSSEMIELNAGTDGSGLWDNGYLQNVTFMLYNSSGNNLVTYVYNCSPWRGTGAFVATWDFVTSFSLHNCTLYDPTIFGISSYPNLTINMSYAIATLGGFHDNMQYNWSMNASDIGGQGKMGLGYNNESSTYNFTFFYQRGDESGFFLMKLMFALGLFGMLAFKFKDRELKDEKNN